MRRLRSRHLESGKHVMCEKPMAKTAAEAREMLAAARRTGKKLTIGYNNRFRSDSQHLKSVCEAGELGDIYYAKAHAIRRRAVPTWGVFLDGEKQGGGPLIDIGTHALDLTLWMMDNYKPYPLRALYTTSWAPRKMRRTHGVLGIPPSSRSRTPQWASSRWRTERRSFWNPAGRSTAWTSTRRNARSAEQRAERT